VPTVERGFLDVSLLDGNGRRQTVDVIDVGLLHHLQELARIRRQALDIAPLALGIDRVEGERRFARTRQTGDDHQLSRGISTSTFLRLCSRAPRTEIDFCINRPTLNAWLWRETPSYGEPRTPLQAPIPPQPKPSNPDESPLEQIRNICYRLSSPSNRVDNRLAR
jgi:hypothetical protein